MATPRPAALAVLLGLAGAVLAAVLGLLTFGAQATARPDHVPLAVVAPTSGPLRALPAQLARQNTSAVSWRVTTADDATKLLDDKEIYGYLDLTTAPAKIVVSGAINALGTQFAQQYLNEVVHQIAKATPGAPTADSVMIHPASNAGRVAPLAASALLWISGLAATLGFIALTGRRGLRTGLGTRSLVAISTSVFGVAVVAGLFRLWDNTLPLDAKVLGFLLLTALAFTTVQGALVRLLGIRAGAILGPLYLIAPAIAGQVPELINPTYRHLLWSWTPFRFSTEGLRSLLQGTPSAPDVRTGIIVLAAMALAGIAVLLLTALRPARHLASSVPGNPVASSLGDGAVSDGSLRKLRSRAGQKAQPDVADGVVDVRVDQADRLPGAEPELPAEDRNSGVRR